MSMNILFVDDELNILKALKRTFGDSKYNLHLAGSAKEGFDILKNYPIDVVVSDVKMANIDGLMFLREVKKLYPHIDRIVLSGFVEIDLILQAITKGIAFDYITKPWENSVLFEKIDSVFQMREQIDDKEIISKINAIENLPIVDESYHEFISAFKKSTSLQKISSIVEKDIALSSLAIKLVNSAFYSSNRLGSVEEAIEIMGVRGIKNIVNYSNITKQNNIDEDINIEIVKYNRLINITNKLFLRVYSILKSENPPKEYETLGVIPYIGQIVLLIIDYEKYKTIVNHMKSNEKLTFWDAELSLNYLNHSHLKLGAYFLNLWNYPALHFQIISNYSTPFLAPENIKEILSILNYVTELVKHGNEFQIESILYTDRENDTIKRSVNII